MSDTGASIGLGISTPDLPVLGSAQISARFQAALNVTGGPDAAQPTTASAPTGLTAAQAPGAPGTPVSASPGAEQSGGGPQPDASDANPSTWRSKPGQGSTASSRGGNERVGVDAHTVAQARSSAGENPGQPAGFTSPGNPQTGTTTPGTVQAGGPENERVGIDTHTVAQATNNVGGNAGQTRGFASPGNPQTWTPTAGTAQPTGQGNEMVGLDTHAVVQITTSARGNSGQPGGFASLGNPQTWATTPGTSQPADQENEMVGIDTHTVVETTTSAGGNAGQPAGFPSLGNPQNRTTTLGVSQTTGQYNEMVGVDSQSVVQVANGALGLSAGRVMPAFSTAPTDMSEPLATGSGIIGPSANVTVGASPPAPTGDAPVSTNLQASPDTTVAAQTVGRNTGQPAAVAQAAVAAPQPGGTSIVAPNTTPGMTSPAALPAPVIAQAAAQPALALPTPGPSNPPPSAAAAQAADLLPATTSAAMPASAGTPSAAQASAAIAAPQITAAPPASAFSAAPASIGVTALPAHGHAANPPLAAPVLLPAGVLLSPMLRNTKGQPPYRRRPQAANPELTRQKTVHGGSAARVVSYTDRCTIPLDLVPATPQATCWRIDETAALVAVGGATVDERAAASRAIALHAALFEAEPLAALGVGEGLSTWEGSPLWLRLAGIAKPASLGILPMEAAPCWIEIMRVEPGLFSVVLSRGAWLAPRITQHPSGPAFLRALRTDLLYGVPANPSGLAALAAAGQCAPPHAWRAQEAWAALLRAQAREASRRLAGVPATPNAIAEARLVALLLAGDPIPPANSSCDRTTLLAADDTDFAGLMGAYANFVLARLSEGDMAAFDSLDGLVLAQRLGRTLRPALLEASA